MIIWDNFILNISQHHQKNSHSALFITVNGILLRKFEEQIELVQIILITYPNPTEKLIERKEINKVNKDGLKINHIRTTETEHSRGINLICLLKDKTLVQAQRME